VSQYSRLLGERIGLPPAALGFVDVAAEAGLDAAGLGMGVIALDYDNDLDFDLYWTTWPGDGRPVPNALYRNLGNLSFEDMAAETGTEDPAGWGISANAGDVDNDGWTDFLVTNGFSPASGPNVLFRNRGDGRSRTRRHRSAAAASTGAGLRSPTTTATAISTSS